MKRMQWISKGGVLVVLALVAVGFGVAAGVFHAIAFTGPSSSAGSGTGTLVTDSAVMSLLALQRLNRIQIFCRWVKHEFFGLWFASCE